MLQFQINMLTAWWAAGQAIRRRYDTDRDRGEVTATTALIVLLVVAAIAAGGVIAAKIAANADNVPEP
jgi:heme A synthase